MDFFSSNMESDFVVRCSKVLITKGGVRLTKRYARVNHYVKVMVKCLFFNDTAEFCLKVCLERLRQSGTGK